jgi:hypothetical protein
VATVDWDDFDFDPLVQELRERVGGPDGEKMIWALEQAVGVARIDPELLDYMLAAVTCLLARATDRSPRDVLEAYVRRAISDEEWHGRYSELFPALA